MSDAPVLVARVRADGRGDADAVDGVGFYASDAFLSVLADVYFPGRKAEPRSVLVNGQVFRLLFVDDREFVTSATFLDYHTPVAVPMAAEDPRVGHVGPVAIRTVQADSIADDRRATLPCAPFVDWSRFPRHDDYLAFVYGRNKRLLKEYDRRRRRLEETFGPLRFSFNDPGDDVLALARTWKAEQLVRTRQKNYFADPRNVAFFDILRSRGLLLASTLRIGDRLVAAWLGYEHEGVVSGWIFAHDPDPELRKYSVGHHLLRDMLAESHRRGHHEFDFSVGGEDYKWLYSSHARLLGDAGAPAIHQQIRHKLVRSVKGQVRKVPILHRLLKAVA